MNLFMCAADLIWSQIFRKFPNLKIALSEGGIGWIPYFLDRIDFTYQHHKAWTHQDFGDKLPSQVFHEHIITCFIDDPTGLKLHRRRRPRHGHVGVRLPALRLRVAARARGVHEVDR